MPDETSPPPAIARDVRESVAQLGNLRAERPELAQLAALYTELLPILFRNVPAAIAPSLAAERAADKLARGEPLLRGESLRLDARWLAERWQQVCALLDRQQHTSERTRPRALASRDIAGPGKPNRPWESRRLADVVIRGAIDPADALQTVLDQGPDHFRSRLEAEAIDEAAGLSLLRFCALPWLASLARELGAAWLQSSGWSRGYCPVCGSWPLLAEFRGLEQFRWLRCNLCASAWPVDRIFCPFCESRDHRQLQNLFIEGQSKYNVAGCDDCRCFVRGISTLTPLTTPGLLVAELETLHLELLALDHGYAAPP